MIYVTVTVSIMKMLYGHYARFTTSKELAPTKEKFLDTCDKYTRG
jgi:hypothetical protein